jgi:hypothetical protein
LREEEGVTRRRLLHDDGLGALQISDQELRGYPGHGPISVVEPLSAAQHEGEGETLLQFFGIREAKLVLVGHGWTIAHWTERNKNKHPKNREHVQSRPVASCVWQKTPINIVAIAVLGDGRMEPRPSRASSTQNRQQRPNEIGPAWACARSRGSGPDTDA